MHVPDFHTRLTIPRLLVERAAQLGAKPYVRYGADVLSYEQVVALSEAAAACLRHDFGIPAGAASALLLPNGSAFVQSWFASLFAGLADVPINHDFRKTALLYGLQNSDARVVFCDASGMEALLDEEVSDFLNRVTLIVLTEAADVAPARDRLATLRSPPQAIALAELTAGRESRRLWEDIEGTALASVRYTSGTTGLPKGIMHSHLHMLYKARAWNAIMQYGSEDTLYSPFPLHHSLASNNGVIATLVAGGSFAGAVRFSASGFWDDVRREKATIGHILDPMVPLLLKQPPRAEDTEHSCRRLWTAWRNADFERRYRTRLQPVYAMAEVGVVAFADSDAPDGSRNCGPALPEMDVRIVDAADQPLPVGEHGEIIVRTREPHRVMLGYRANLEATMRAFYNLWYHTGDEGFVDAQGDLHFLGRLGDGIRRRGVNISADQVEQELLRNPAVLECAVIGVPSELGEHDILAFVVWAEAPADEPAALKELGAFALERMPKQYAPRYFQGIDSLPRTNTGKLQKRLLPVQPSTRRWDRDAA